MKTMETDFKKNKISRRKKLIIWLLIDLVVIAIVLAVLLYRPGRYKPIDSGSYKEGEVSPYLTNELSPTIYNGAQRIKPFDVVITQEGLNDIIARGDWPKESEGIMLYAPAALFIPDRLVLMGTADAKGVEFVVTIELEPIINEEGLLNLQLAKMKIGAMNLTPLVKVIAKKMYMQKISGFEVDTKALQTQIVASLLSDEPFEPVFSIDGKKVRIEKITIENEKLSAHLVPAL
ncbi:MAG: YpmS family protein [Planctomycetes bacterium]|nr:YpmS family protein [Planctomycetota bacterium]